MLWGPLVQMRRAVRLASTRWKWKADSGGSTSSEVSCSLARGGVKADPEARGRERGRWCQEPLAGDPRPQGNGCAWISGPTLTTRSHHSEHSRTLTGTSAVPPPPARSPGCGVSWNAAESGPGPPLPASAAWRVRSRGGPGRSV